MLHCSKSTTLESFSDGILVESNASHRLADGEMGRSMNSDQVGLEILNAPHL